MKVTISIILFSLIFTSVKAQSDYYVLFDYNKSEVPDTAMAFLVKKIYSQNITQVYLEGHCDSIGSRGYNYDLSQRRVSAVENLLVENGFDRNKINGKVGFGKDKPLLPNSDAASRQLNRRVLIKFVGGNTLKKIAKKKSVKQVQDQNLVEELKTIKNIKSNSAHLLVEPKARITLTKKEARLKKPHKEIGSQNTVEKLKTIKAVKTRSDHLMIEPKAVKPAAKKIVKQKKPAKKPKPLKIENFKPNATIELPNLLFQGGRHYLINESNASLDTLVRILKSKPLLRIEIQGHVCCTTYQDDGYDWDTKTHNLSVNRAKAIMAFLVKKGISSTRLRTKGFGGSQKLFPSEENKYQRQRNRRVEVMILP